MAGHGHVTPNADGTKAKCGGPGICGQCSIEWAQRRVDTPAGPSFVQARQAMAQAFRDDKGLLQAYHANVAMLVSDRYHITSKPIRDAMARDILALVFGLTEQEASP